MRMRKALDAVCASAQVRRDPVPWMVTTFPIDGWRVATDGGCLLIVRDSRAAADDLESHVDADHRACDLARELAAAAGTIPGAGLLEVVDAPPCRHCEDRTFVQCAACDSTGVRRYIASEPGCRTTRRCPDCLDGWRACHCNGNPVDVVRVLGVPFSLAILRRVLRHADASCRWGFFGDKPVKPLLVTDHGWALVVMPMGRAMGRVFDVGLAPAEAAAHPEVLRAAEQSIEAVRAVMAERSGTPARSLPDNDPDVAMAMLEEADRG